MIEWMRSSRYRLAQDCPPKMSEVLQPGLCAFKLPGHFDAYQAVIELSVSHYAPNP